MNVSPKNKYTRRLREIQKPISGALLLSLAMGPSTALLAQIPAAAPTNTVVPAVPEAPMSATPAPATPLSVAQPATTPKMPVAPILPTGMTPFRPRPPAKSASATAGGDAAANAGGTNATPSKGAGTLTTDLPPGSENKFVALKYKDSPLDLILDNVAEWTGRMLIKAPGVTATVTLTSNDKIPIPQALEAIETVLSMNNVGLVKMGDKFLKVVPIANIQPEGKKINFQPPEKAFPEADQLVSQVIQLKYMEPAEAQPILQMLLHGYGKIQVFERTNSLLITDTGSNLNRIQEVLAYIDQPVESKIETRIYEIHYAKASEVASRLNELIAETQQGKEEKPRIENPVVSPTPAFPTPPGVIRAPRPAGTTTTTVSPSGETPQEAAERGVIHGKVKIVSDERLNLLFIISRAENFVFFDKIITVLDRATDPEITLRVVSLQFAKAEEIASILNEFIGAAKEDTSKSGAGAAAAAPGTAAAGAGSQTIRDFIAARQAAAAPQPAAPRARLAPITEAEKDVIGRVSPNTRILAYKPTNTLLLMGRRNDLAALDQIIDKLDVMLAQVLIEVVIINVALGDNVSYGIEWLQKSMTAYNTTKPGPGGGMNVSQPIMGFGGGSTAGHQSGPFIDGADVNRGTIIPPSAVDNLTYYTTLYGLNLDMIIHLAAGSSDARVLSTPVIMTTDNKEADIKVGQQVPIQNATVGYNTGQNTVNYEYKDVGLEIKVTPRINPNGVVEMEIKQEDSSIAGGGGTTQPTINNRAMSGNVSVRHNQTVILGGLTQTTKNKTRIGIPILMDIPILGALFRSDTLLDQRNEVLVLITPYVLKSPEEAREETARLHAASGSSKTRWHEGWTDSELPRMSEKELQELLARRKTRLLKMDENEKDSPSRVSTSFAPDDIRVAAPAARASNTTPPAATPADAPQTQPAPAATPAVPKAVAPAAPVPVAPAAVPVPAAATPPVEAPKPVDPNAPVPLR